MKKIKLLYILNIAKRVNNFSYTSMMAAQACGIEFHIAGNWSYESDEERMADEEKYGIKIYQVDFIRTPYHPGNRKAYAQLKEIVKREQFDIIHCNTPIGGILGRMAAKKYKVPNVIYQVHGFHFYKGAPLLNHLIYYPIEKYFARNTDVLVTFNHEDFELAKSKMKLRKGGKVCYVPGVGIDTSLFELTASSRDEKREQLGIPKDSFVVISVGELNANKNNGVIISAIGKMNNDNVHYVMCGTGEEGDKLKKQAKELGLQDRVHFIGFRTDIGELYGASDCFVMSSKREGLSRSIMEAMSCGLPCVVSKIRGNVDLIEDGIGGFLCDIEDSDVFAEKLSILAEDAFLRTRMSENNLQTIKKFSVQTVIDGMKNIYLEMNERM